ncbi:MAG TPA: gamma-glutamyl-gamma-aminobutyrate hydrolase family protein, partial [Thermoanaerobaculia bacterium]
DRDASRSETNDYVRALVAAGFSRDEIVSLPPGSVPAGDFDGVVLGGGCDVHPKRYGQEPREDAHLDLDPERDETDFAVVEKAWAEDVPVLAICRGLQVVNVALGGTLVQDIPSQRPSPLVHERSKSEKTRRDHPVRIVPGTRLAQVVDAPEIFVNSRHHQAIERPGRRLVVSAKAPDGMIEAVEADDSRWLVAVQWHPENLAGDAPSERLFEEFARAVKERASVQSAP